MLHALVSNAQDLKDTQDRQYSDMRRKQTIKFLSRCGMNINELEKHLPIIHVSGTKGKGSTCAFTESILRQYGNKTGFFPSPHLVSVRERIQINGQPISKPLFVRYFWEIYCQLEEMKENEADMPTQFIFLTIMALKVFLSENVNVAIFEVGIGGEYDCTNIFRTVNVAGISSLGLEHTKLLGTTIEEIAWQKSGIMKPNSIAITSGSQCLAALQVLRRRANEKQSKLFEAPSLDEYTWLHGTPKFGIDGPSQHLNASLALQLANCYLNPHVYKEMEFSNDEESYLVQAPIFAVSKQMMDGLQYCFWPGRTQVQKYSEGITYYLDGAHTSESIKQCLLWYQRYLSQQINDKQIMKILIFNVTGDRSYSTFFTYLTACHFDFVFFCPNIISKVSDSLELVDLVDINEEQVKRECIQMRDEWLKISSHMGEDNVKIFTSISDTMYYINSLHNCITEYHILVTGSLYLVGGVLKVLKDASIFKLRIS